MSEDQVDRQAEDAAALFGCGCLVYIIMFLILFVCVVFGISFQHFVHPQ